ncbi:MAG TPA: site-specific integrase [Pseudonocardiaceae bacterium]|nr:site-specific integrase [Pseudonocardiaceae bacterium]
MTASPDNAPAQHPGLLAKLMAAVRPEFRADVIDIDPADPVFGGPPCRVPDCRRIARTRGLCIGHYNRWQDAGQPDLEQFSDSTSPLLRGHAPVAACQVPDCRFGQRSGGLCPRHWWVWDRAGKPELASWLAELPDTVRAPAAPPRECLVSYCDLWARPNPPRLCESHARRWVANGRPDLAEYVRGYDEATPSHEQLNFQGLGGQLKLEMQYALQCRHDDGEIKTPPSRVRHVVLFVARSGAQSLLDWTEEAWKERFPRTSAGASNSSRALLVYARRRVEELQHGRGWDVEYPRDLWRLRHLGVDSPHAHLRFAGIPQSWLKELVKRWVRWRLGAGICGGQANKCVTVLTRFAQFLASPAGGVATLAEIDRAVLERYLADLRTLGHSVKSHSEHIGLVNAFFQAIRQHRWDDSLHSTAVFFAEDYPKRPTQLPRALAEHVMAQVERPDNLDRWPDPAGRLATVILMRCGLRVSDALKLPFDCVVRDADAAPYLRYFNHKMKREALVPIDEEVERAIGEQQRRVLERWPHGAPILFPQPTANPEGRKPLSTSTYRIALRRWLDDCDVRDQHGQPVRLTPHQWRHTFGTRLINRDVPQEVVRVLLDHDSHMMTAHYARLNEKTVRKHWEQARKVNIKGETVTLDPEGQLAEAAWAKQRLGRVTQALPNGYCGLPLQKTCPHANACLTCPMFATTAEFLPQHRAQRQQLLQIISAAEARGQARLAEMNQQVLGNLDKVITALEADEGQAAEEVADAG